MKEVKRVLHIVGAMNRGGTETMLMNLYRNIDRDKLQFDFVSFSQEDAHYDDEIRSMGGKIIKIDKPRFLGFNKSINDICSSLVYIQFFTSVFTLITRHIDYKTGFEPVL